MQLFRLALYYNIINTCIGWNNSFTAATIRILFPDERLIKLSKSFSLQRRRIRILNDVSGLDNIPMHISSIQIIFQTVFFKKIVWFSGTKQVSRHCSTSKIWSSCGNPTGSACSRTYRRSTDDSTTTHDPSNLRTSNDGNASCFMVQLHSRMQFAKKL